VEKTIITTSWDDGHPADLRLAKLLKKYDIPATFYIPIVNVDGKKTMTKEDIKTLSKEFDIGGHTYSHKRLTHLSDKEAFDEIVKGKKALEEICNKSIEMFCYPGGKYEKKHVKMIKKAGFIGARTTRVLEYKSPVDFYQLGTTIQKGNNIYGHILPHFRKSGLTGNIDLSCHLSIKYLITANNFDFCQEAFDYVKKKGGIFHLWGHSHEIEKKNYWHELENLFKSIAKTEDILLVNNTELVRLIQSDIG